MTQLKWDQVGERRFENGVDRGVLYLVDDTGKYDGGVAWNGLTAVTEKPTGAAANPKYADNQIYVSLRSAEQFGGTIQAYTYPEEFGHCDGTAAPKAGVLIGQQQRKTFGLCYRTKVGQDGDNDHGYKLHLVYGATASPSDKAFNTINDQPDAITFSWDITTIPVDVGTIAGVDYKPTSILTVDSTKVDPADLATLEAALYGDAQGSAHLPLPADVVAMFTDPVAPAGLAPDSMRSEVTANQQATSTEVTPEEPSYNATSHVLTVPAVTGVAYYMGDTLGDEITPATDVTLTQNTVVVAAPEAGYTFPADAVTRWDYTIN